MQDKTDLYNKLAYYTLAHTDPSFIHQHIVDAFTAQNADSTTKPIAITFALAGLYLYLGKSYTGKQVQKAHMRMAARKRSWPTFVLPEQRGCITASDVLAKPAGQKRDAMIRRWCEEVWAAYHASHQKVAELVDGLV